MSAITKHDQSLTLIVGAGPAGLATANVLQKFRQRYILIDQRTGPSDASKATGLHSNTLKLLDKLNLAEVIYSQSIELDWVNSYLEGELVQEIQFKQGVAINDKNISIEQSAFERILHQQLQTDEGACQWGKQLIAFEQSDENVIATIQDIATGELKQISADFVIAADGARSLIRKKLGFSFEGETTPETSFTFDAKVISPPMTNIVDMYTKGEDRLVSVPLPMGKCKFSGKIPEGWLNTYHAGSHDELAAIVHKRSGIVIDPATIVGVSFYHTASRIASCIQERRIFLIGDAAHVFFPAGGYGLNVAIEDAFSLAWRITLAGTPLFTTKVLHGFSHERLLNAAKIQEDSNRKKIASSEISKTAEKTVSKEVQVYQAENDQNTYTRIDTLLKVKFDDRVYGIIHKNVGFSVLVNIDQCSSESFALIKAFAQQIEDATPLSFQVITLLAEEQHLLPPRSACLIRPDNFAKIISLEELTSSMTLESIV